MPLEIIAHRGYSSIAPENTLAAFLAAIEHQADSIEFDVQLSADGVPMVIHDSTLTRTTRIRGKVRKKTLEQIKRREAGSWFDLRFKGEPIPTLEEALSALQNIKKFIYIEVKTHSYWTDEKIDELIDMLLKYQFENRCIIASFNASFIDRIRERSDNFSFAYLVANRTAFRRQLTKAAQAGNTVMMSKYKLLIKNPSLISLSRAQGVDIVAWTVDKPKDLEKLLDLGIVRIATNCLVPEMLDRKIQ
ncbi:glycerophosphodiester phosphodiesterase [Phormidium pseudopriestleyi FRX01]|uniref:Glycerophosphodiester phosphodiesterase n=1 Tax=Phormidium pseudopriestleyi FRX01 TaxID=1759528 RepID=A0ABS3FQK2_9CYAN|nr:glycerophosphodiester phosphodiesterase family protein [Phormidium pseudopriestleyi]MBO0349405.1 glycerophosphodiester phosphodiesterase [Phormidium pseudopriestleyi FRX01]